MPMHNEVYGYKEELWSEVIKQQDETGERDLPTILSLIGSLGKGEEIVDLGCGTGRISNLLARDGYRVTGVDLSSKCIEAASRSAAEMGVSSRTRYLVGDYRDVSIFSDKCYGAAICLLAPAWDSLEDFSRALKSLSAVVCRGGLLLLRETVKERFIALINAAPSVLSWFRLSGNLLSLHSWDYDHAYSRVRSTKEFYRKTGESGSLSFLTRISREYVLYGIADYVRALEDSGWEVKSVLEDPVDLLHIRKYNDPWLSFSALFVATLP